MLLFIRKYTNTPYIHQVMGTCIQKMNSPNLRTFVGPGKISELMLACNQTGARTLVVDDDLTPKQQRSLETELATMGGSDVKVLDRTAVILEIFAQHASTKEGQLQVELAQLQVSPSRSQRFYGQVLYTVGILCDVEWCIRQLSFRAINHTL